MRFWRIEKLSKTIGLAPLRDFCKYVLYTGFVENAPRPVSGLVVAEAERGKSTESQKWEGIGVITLQDLTSFGITRIVQEMSERDKKMIHHIVVPDLEKIGSRNRDVRNELLSMFRVIMDEGLQQTSTGRQRIDEEEPIRLGVLMCTTPEDLGDRRSVFRTLSFQSRVIPFTYDFSDGFKAKILEFVETEDHAVREKFFFKKEEKTKVKLSPKYSKKLNIYAILLARRLEAFSRKSPCDMRKENRLIGIRTKENLMTLLKAIALYHGRSVVKKRDFEEFRRLYRHMNYKIRNIDEID
jgi:hypothetical protein